MNDSSLQIFEKISSRPLSSLSLISHSFLLLFEIIEILMAVSTRALQNFFLFQKQKCNLFAHHQTLNPLTHTPHIFPIPLPN